MPEKFRISDLPTSASFNDADIMEVSQVDNDSPSGFSSVKKTVLDIANKILKNINFTSDLNTTDKTVIGAINEVDGDIPANSDFSLSGLSDTTITNPSSGQMLSYDNGKWKNVGAVDISSDITWNETTVSTGTAAYRVGNMVFITYMGANTTHAANDVLFVMPASLRPSTGWRVAFTSNAGAYGNLGFYTNGNVTINQISDNTVTGRIYFSVAYPIA